MQKYIGRQLKTARLNKKLTQEQIAEAVGISAKHYGWYRTRRGKYHCSRTDTVAAGAGI